VKRGPESGKAIELSDQERLVYSSRIADKATRTPDGCLKWTGAVTGGKEPRPRLLLRGRETKAARIVVACREGKLPAGLLVLHTCDNPLCVHPAHLLTGTHADNIADRERRGRTLPRVVSRKYRAMTRKHHFGRKTSKTDATDMRRRVAEGETLRSIARLYRVAPGTVRYWAGDVSKRH